MKNKDKILVAVYGSLKKDFGNHGLLHDSKFVATGVTGPIYNLIGKDNSFPGIIDGNKQVVVEVYEISLSTLKNLDGLEGHPRFYIRELTTISILDNSVSAWIYKLPISYGDRWAEVTDTSEEHGGAKVWKKPIRRY